MSGGEKEVCDGSVDKNMDLQEEAGEERRERKRVRNAVAGRIFGGYCERKLVPGELGAAFE